MGKKLERAMAKEKNQSPGHDSTDDANKTPEQYKCTGNFNNDFTEMCRRLHLAVIPPVLLRPRLPGASGSHDSKQEKSGGRGKQAAPEPEPEPEIGPDGEPVEPPPKTYVTKEKFEYFKPCVQVEMDHPDKGDTVTEVFIKGWKIDAPMMGILQMCWPAMDKLHSLHLWEVGLTGETLQLLASSLPLCANLKNLVLDGNNVKEENFSSLIGENSPIVNLSLRYCSITSKGAEGIGMALAAVKKSTPPPNPEATGPKLLSLNLSGNLIDDEGAEYIARGLKMNRTLLSLSLNANKIGDKGAAKLAEALSRFPLTHEEVVERRRLLSDRSPDRSSPHRREGRPGSVRSNFGADKDKKGTKTAGKKKGDTKGKDGKDDTKAGKKEDTRGQSRSKDRGASMASGDKTTGGRTTKGKTPKKTVGPDPDVYPSEVNHPLMETAEMLDEQLWVPGNRVLINLNLARNQIGEAGLSALLKGVQYQTTLAMFNKQGGTGLLRLCLQRNNVEPDNAILKKLTQQMLPKDPFYKSPVMEKEA